MDNMMAFLSRETNLNGIVHFELCQFPVPVKHKGVWLHSYSIAQDMLAADTVAKELVVSI